VEYIFTQGFHQNQTTSCVRQEISVGTVDKRSHLRIIRLWNQVLQMTNSIRPHRFDLFHSEEHDIVC